MVLAFTNIKNLIFNELECEAASWIGTQYQRNLIVKTKP